MAAYSLSRKCLKYRNFFALAFYFTMVFNAGLVPWYIIVTKLGIKDSIWVLILPMCFNPFNMLLMRNYFKSLPDAVIESAKIDGAGEYRIFTGIMLPMALPGLAVITLFYMLSFWNDWWMALLFINDTKLYPLQFLLRKILSNIIFASKNPTMINKGAIPQETVKMATCIVTIGPIIFVYPFIQRYFVKGITIGAVKG
jgi:putative aldouronate transport system permease protein